MSRHPTYVVIINVPTNVSIEVGALGKISFRRGYYIYVGSGGRYPLKRIRRHFRRDKKLKWHVDYLTNLFPAVGAYILWGLEDGEWVLAEDLRRRYDYVPGFGSSDKPSKSHLYYIGGRDELNNVIKYLVDRYGAEKVPISDDNIPP